MATPRRKACVECRQQKIRCDVEQHKTPHDPCSRCKKMNLECRILPTSTRNLRQTKAEMRRELEELRWGMRHPGAAGANDSNHPAQHSTPSSNNVDVHVFSPMEQGSGTFSNPSGPSEASASMSPSFAAADGVQRKSDRAGHGVTVPRGLDGYMVDAKRIDDCFALFLSQYHPLLPILDDKLTANDYYELSPFLFWCIIVTGSRRYTEDSNILDKVSQLITPLAFSSMALRSTPIPVIQGLLILCTWRLPTNSMYKDMTHVLCGAAVHLATQIGLHVAGVGQDFARMPLKKDRDQKIFRAKLWMHCVIVSIRTCCAEGIPPLVIAESFFDGDERDQEDMDLPADLRFLHKVHIILLRAMAAMVRTDLKSMNCDVNVLRSLISIFDSQLLRLVPSSPSDLDTFQLNCARVHVLAFHFFATHVSPDAENLSRLYSLCVSTIQSASKFANEGDFATFSQSFIDRTISLAGFVILKLVRSPLAQHLDLGAGEQAYFNAVQFSSKTSLQSNDLGARVAAIMANLWGSSKIFRRKDNSVESLGLRLRTRLSMSVCFDMFWYWREEFGHMANPYNGEENIVSTNVQTRPGTPDYEKQAPQPQPMNSNTAPTSSTAAAAAPPKSLLPINKMDPEILNPSIPSNPNPNVNPAAMNFDNWATAGAADFSMPPMLDQFPDYDWAASFDFSNDWPAVPMGMAPMPDGQGFHYG